MSTLLMFTKNNWKSGSDCHCDIIFHWKMTKLVVKCIRQVQTRHIFVGTISNFAKQISNVDIIDFCKKNDENRILTVTVTSLLTIIFDPKWQGSWWNTLGKSNCGINFQESRQTLLERSHVSVLSVSTKKKWVSVCLCDIIIDTKLATTAILYLLWHFWLHRPRFSKK